MTQPRECDLQRGDAPANPIRAVMVTYTAVVPSPFPYRVPGWCTSDNIVLAPGPRSHR